MSFPARKFFSDKSRGGSDGGAMATRYEQLVDLHDRATERLIRQHDAARQVARHVVDHPRKSLGLAATDRAVATCEVPSEDVVGLTNPGEVPVEHAVATDDETNYRLGVIVSVSSKQGNSRESVLFLVTLRHVINDRFEVRPFPNATPVTCAATGSQHEPLGEISDQIYETLSAHFTAVVKGEPRRPLGFVPLSQ